MKYTIAILFPVWLTAQVAADDFLSRKELAITEDTTLAKALARYAVPYDGPSNSSDVDPSTLTGKVMAGYQGWFRCEGDGAGQGWVHWGHNGRFDNDHCSIDFWPDVSEYDEDEKFRTPFQYKDGTPAYVFSSYKRKTVFRHFQWMKQYGIDGVFPQRFQSVTIGRDMNRTAKQIAGLGVLSHVRDAANYHGRTYAVMYDCSFGKQDWDRLLHDWKILHTEMQLTQDPVYLKHNGKPVVAFWGYLFGHRRFDLKATREAFELLRTDPDYGPATILLGIDSRWSQPNFEGSGFHTGKVKREYYEMADILLPWKVAERDQSEIEMSRIRYARDLQWCKKRSIEYFPVISPGFSWHNLKQHEPGHEAYSASEYAPRRNGELLAEKFTAVKKADARQAYVAMFDEVDEGTAIFKCSVNHPISDRQIFVPYRVPSDHYLRMTADGGRLLRGEMSLDDFRKRYVK